jgi:hypothetical protein
MIDFAFSISNLNQGYGKNISHCWCGSTDKLLQDKKRSNAPLFDTACYYRKVTYLLDLSLHSLVCLNTLIPIFTICKVIKYP